MAATLTPEGRKGVDAYTVAELHQFLVEDAVKHHATFLPWAVAAYSRIGARKGGAESAYQKVLDDVEAITGSRMMPRGSPLAQAELDHLLRPL